jgi:hypothetical protein
MAQIRTVAWWQSVQGSTEALQVIADLGSRCRKRCSAPCSRPRHAAFRVDPWLTGSRSACTDDAAGAPFRLGAYGWVDAPASFNALDGCARA